MGAPAGAPPAAVTAGALIAVAQGHEGAQHPWNGLPASSEPSSELGPPEALQRLPATASSLCLEILHLLCWAEGKD